MSRYIYQDLVIVLSMELSSLQPLTPSASSHLARFLCQMPNLSNMTVKKLNVHHDFYRVVTSYAPPWKVHYPMYNHLLILLQVWLTFYCKLL